jgi:hypothetical protein
MRVSTLIDLAISCSGGAMLGFFFLEKKLVVMLSDFLDHPRR